MIPQKRMDLDVARAASSPGSPRRSWRTGRTVVKSAVGMWRSFTELARAEPPQGIRGARNHNMRSADSAMVLRRAVDQLRRRMGLSTRTDHGISGSARADSAIQELAARQHGVVARAQLVEAGLSEHRIEYRLECGLLTPVYRAVYAVRAPAGRLKREFAAVLAAGADSFVSHRAAGAILELMPPLRVDVPVEMSTLRDVRIGGGGIRIHRVSGLESDEVMIRYGLPLTGPARTILDLAGVCGARDLERALATAIRQGAVEREDIQALLDRYPSRRGRGRLRALMAVDGGPAFTRSEAERRFLDLVRAGGVPRPETNVVVEGFEVDFFWREQRLVVEVDGRAYHDGNHAFEGDRDRDAALMAAGFRTMRVTWRQIVRESPRLLVRLGQALVR